MAIEAFVFPYFVLTKRASCSLTTDSAFALLAFRDKPSMWPSGDAGTKDSQVAFWNYFSLKQLMGCVSVTSSRWAHCFVQLTEDHV